MNRRIKMVNLFLALIALAFFLSGCAESSKDTRIKCAKCSSTYTIDEGLSETQKPGEGK
jgi:outer membrane lipoprotein-sorting protein